MADVDFKLVLMEEWEIRKWDFFPEYVKNQLMIPLAYAFGFVNYRELRKVEKVKTRKVHRCYECRREIKPGETAYKLILRKGSKWFSVYYHEDCYKRRVKKVLKTFNEALEDILLNGGVVNMWWTGW